MLVPLLLNDDIVFSKSDKKINVDEGRENIKNGYRLRSAWSTASIKKNLKGRVGTLANSVIFMKWKKIPKGIYKFASEKISNFKKYIQLTVQFKISAFSCVYILQNCLY